MSPFDSNDRSPLLQCPPLVSKQRNLLLQCPAPFNINQTSSLLQLMSSPGQTPEESVEEPPPLPGGRNIMCTMLHCSLSQKAKKND